MKTLTRPNNNLNNYTGHRNEYLPNNSNNKLRYDYIRKEYFRSHVIDAKCLEMGVLSQEDTFVCEARYLSFVLLIVDYNKLRIRVEFCVQTHQKSFKFKLEIDFKDIDKIFLEEHGNLWAITISNKYPARYWVYDDKKDEYNWKRINKIKLAKKNNNEPIQQNMQSISEQLGKWVVFRIKLDISKVGINPQGHNILRLMIKKTQEEYNLITKIHKPLNLVSGANLYKNLDYSMLLDFDVLYMVECNLSFNYIHHYNLDWKFFDLLSRQPKQAAIYILKKIHDGKKRIYDPFSYLCSEIQKLNNVEIKEPIVPDHCAMMRKVEVTPTTMYMLIPTMETSNRVIRHFQKQKDNFLRVHFVDEGSRKVGSTNGNENDTYNDALYNRIFHTLKNGIKIGDVHYEFLAFSSSQLRDHSCWFFASTKDLSADDIRDWMGDFADIKTVAKYAARMGQCFSSTRAIQRLPVNDINQIDDIKTSIYTFSDGIGKISNSLARTISGKLELKSVPSAFQFRMAGYKGMLCQSPSLKGNQVQVRPSQLKFNSTHNVLEIIRCSSYLPAFLNRQAITLLSVLGIPDKVFVDMKDQQVNELDKIFENENTAVNILRQNVDEYEISRSLAELVKAGFLQKKDRYLMNLISLFRIMILRDLKKKAKIRVDKGTFLLGVLDETKTLKENQVYCCVSDPYNPSSRKLITGKCIVYRNPCFHPGDIRIVEAVKCEALSDLVDVVVFPAVGDRDIPNQCSGGDLDGDDFTLIYDEKLIPNEMKDPMNYESPKPEVVDHVTMDDIKRFFVNYVFSDQLGKIANAHLAKADGFDVGAAHGECIRLAQLHSEAVDFPKTGIPAIIPPNLRAKEFPDFMEKPDKPIYRSKKVLGGLYRSIKEEDYKPYTHLEFDHSLYVKGFEKYLEDARILKNEYDNNIKGLMNQFGILTEFEVTSGYIVNTITEVDKKKPRDIVKSVMDAFIPIRRHFRKKFEEEFSDEMDAFSQRRSKAFAWYYVTYHPSELGDENMISFPWIVCDILCDISIRNSNKINSMSVEQQIQLVENKPTSHSDNGNGNRQLIQPVENKPTSHSDNGNGNIQLIQPVVNKPTSHSDNGNNNNRQLIQPVVNKSTSHSDNGNGQLQPAINKINHDIINGINSERQQIQPAENITNNKQQIQPVETNKTNNNGGGNDAHDFFLRRAMYDQDQDDSIDDTPDEHYNQVEYYNQNLSENIEDDIEQLKLLIKTY